MSSTRGLEYNNYTELYENIRIGRNPDTSTKRRLYSLIDGLTKEDHLLLFTQYLYPLEKRIYTISNDRAMFDINDLPSDTFWKMYIDCLNLDQNRRRTQYIDNIVQPTPVRLVPDRIDSTVCDDQMTEYERLRISALYNI